MAPSVFPTPSTARSPPSPASPTPRSAGSAPPPPTNPATGALASAPRIPDATLGRFGNPAANEPVAVAIVPKNHAALVIALEEVRRPNDKRMYSYVSKKTSQLLVLLAGLRVRGRSTAAG